MPAGALLINADDLGLWPSVDQGILWAWSQRAIGDSTVFATAPNLPDILLAARDAGLPVGVHLNLTMGLPLSNPREIPALVTPRDTFMRRALWTLPLPVDQVRLELQRQVQRVCDLGCRPSHLDSHHHIHRYPEIFSVVTALAREFRLPVRALDEEMQQALRTAGIPAPDHFSMAFYSANATMDTLTTVVESCPGGILEIMTHPGYAGSGLPSSYREEREQELSVLTSPEWGAYLRKRGLSVIGYGEL